MGARPRRGVAILGGGVAGMSAAHELAQRGYHVTVFEAKSTQGGKARSIFVPGTGTNGRRDLPGEHGFRFFPAFYKHLPDTMKNIPFGKGSVHDNLVPTSRTMFAREGAIDFQMLTHFPRTVEDIQDIMRLRRSDFNLTPQQYLFIAQRFWTLLTTCQERRTEEYDRIGWWQFMDVDRHSPEYQHLVGEVSVRFLVAMDARKASTRTVGNIGMQLWLDHMKPGVHVDRLLNGPTHDVWLDPWLAHLRHLGVDYRMNSQVERIRCLNDRVVEVTIREANGKRYQFADDYFIAALPVERMRRLVSPEMIESEPRMAHLDRLQTEWMIGLQFFLNVDVKLSRGHVIINDCPWALTAISQKQFWPGVDLSRFGDGTVDGILSVDISDWNAPGDHCGRMARDCTREEIIAEVWEELKRHLNDTGEVHSRGSQRPVLVPCRQRAPLQWPVGQRGAAAHQHREYVEGAAACADRDPQLLPRLRLCADEYRRRDHGSGQRSRTACGERHPRGLGVERAALSHSGTWRSRASSSPSSALIGNCSATAIPTRCTIPGSSDPAISRTGVRSSGCAETWRVENLGEG